MKRLIPLLFLLVASTAFAATSAVERKSVPMAQKFITTEQDLGTVIDEIEASGVPTQLNLAPGTYTECAIVITAPIKISIVGSGVHNTVIQCSVSSATNVFDISGQDSTSYIRIADLFLNADMTGTGSLYGIYYNQSAGESILESQFVLDNLKVKIYSDLGHSTAGYFLDVAVRGTNLDFDCDSDATAKDTKCFYQEVGVGLDKNLTSNISASRFYAESATTSSSYSARPYMSRTNNSNHSGFSNTLNSYNVDAISNRSGNTGEGVACYCINDDTATNGTQICNYYGGTCGGDYRAYRHTTDLNATLTVQYYGTHFYGSNYIPDLFQKSGTATTVQTPNVMSLLGLYNVLTGLPSLTGTNSVTLDGVDLMSLTGQTGGSNILASGSATSGEGADILLTSGLGGASVGTTGASIGGSGGDIVLLASNGGAQTNASGTTNTGGAGGYIELEAGDGGVANSGSSTDTGGAGHDVYIKAGAGGVGTDATGSNGHIYLGVDSADNLQGNVGIGMTNNQDPTGPLVVNFPAAQTIAAGNVITDDGCGTIKSITAAGAVTTDTTNTFTAPAAGNKGCCMHVVNTGANAITLDNNANFVSNGAADVALGAGDTAYVCSSGASGKWYQIGATGNN
jgi:hypothetical protein